jgi:hypothetical protein
MAGGPGGDEDGNLPPVDHDPLNEGAVGKKFSELRPGELSLGLSKLVSEILSVTTGCFMKKCPLWFWEFFSSRDTYGMNILIIPILMTEIFIGYDL